MDEDPRLAERLARIDALRRGGAVGAVVLGELRALVHDACLDAEGSRRSPSGGEPAGSGAPRHVTGEVVRAEG